MPTDPKPRLVLAVGQQMVDIMTVHDGLMEYVAWDRDHQRWICDNQYGLGDEIARGLNVLKYRPKTEVTDDWGYGDD